MLRVTNESIQFSFILSVANNSNNSETLFKLEKEQELHKDLIVFDAEDAYRMSSFRVLFAMRVFLEECYFLADNDFFKFETPDFYATRWGCLY